MFSPSLRSHRDWRFVLACPSGACDEAWQRRGDAAIPTIPMRAMFRFTSPLAAEPGATESAIACAVLGVLARLQHSVEPGSARRVGPGRCPCVSVLAYDRSMDRRATDAEVPSWWRSSTPPADWDDGDGVNEGVVSLPLHLSWSGPSSLFDLDDPAELRVVYSTVLREGTSADVKQWLNPVTLVEIWDTLWLPRAVHEAWDGWIAERRSRAAA